MKKINVFIFISYFCPYYQLQWIELIHCLQSYLHHAHNWGYVYAVIPCLHFPLPIQILSNFFTIHFFNETSLTCLIHNSGISLPTFQFYYYISWNVIFCCCSIYITIIFLKTIVINLFISLFFLTWWLPLCGK